MGANFDDIPVNNLILRRPRSGRLEGWATHEIVEKAGSQHLLCCPPFETRPCGPLLRVRFVCKLAPMSAALPAKTPQPVCARSCWIFIRQSAIAFCAVPACLDDGSSSRKRSHAVSASAQRSSLVSSSARLKWASA